MFSTSGIMPDAGGTSSRTFSRVGGGSVGHLIFELDTYTPKIVCDEATAVWRCRIERLSPELGLLNNRV
jgi:hypothetical protein